MSRSKHVFENRGSPEGRDAVEGLEKADAYSLLEMNNGTNH